MFLLVEVARVARGHLDEVVAPLLLVEPGLRRVVRGEDRAGGAELGDHVRDRAALRIAEGADAGAGELEHAAAPAADTPPAEQLQDHVFRLNPRPRELVLEEDPDDLRRRQLERVSSHADGHVQPARADRDHRARARLGRVRVRADECLARLREPLAVHVVADAVPGPREPGSVLGGHRLQEAVVVRVLEIDLEDVVVDVDDGRLDADAILAEQLELHHRHRPGGVLRERLVDAKPDLAAGSQVAAFEVLFEDRPGEGGHPPKA